MQHQGEIRVSGWRNVIAALIPAAIMIFFIGYLVESYTAEKRIARESQTQIRITSKLRQGMLILQQIRGLEQIAFNNRNSDRDTQVLLRRILGMQEEFLDVWDGIGLAIKQANRTDKARFEQIDKQIRDKFLRGMGDHIDPRQSFAEYTALISDLQYLTYLELDVTLRHMDSVEVLRGRLSMFSQYLHHFIENIGRLRGYGSGSLAHGKLAVEDMREWVELLGAAHKSLENLDKTGKLLAAGGLPAHTRISAGIDELKAGLGILNEVISRQLGNDARDLSAETYFEMASGIIGKAAVQHDAVDGLLMELDELKYADAISKIEIIIALGCFALATLGVLTYTLVRKNSAALWNMKRSNEALTTNERQMRAILELVPGLIALRDKYGHTLLSNSKYRDFANAVIGAGENSTAEDDDDGKLMNLFNTDSYVLASGMSVHGKQALFHTRNGQPRVLQVSKLPYQFSETSEKAVLTVAYDVTDLYMVKELQEVAGVGYWEWDFSRDRFAISEIFARKFLPSNQEDMGINGFLTNIDEADRRVVCDAFERARSLRQPVDLEYQSRDNMGQLRTLRLKSRFYHRTVENSVMLVGTAQDISAEKQATKALVESERKFRKLVENLHGGYFFYSYTADGECTYVSPSVERILGISAKSTAAYAAMNRYFVFDEHDAGSPTRMRVCDPRHREIEFRRADDSLRYLELSEVPVYSTQGKITSYDGIAHDITEHRLIERDLRESEACMRALVGHLENVRELEREKMAHDIHDELGGYLVALKMDISLLSKRIDRMDKSMLSRLNSMKQLLDIAIDTTRRIITSLRPSILDELGLWEAIEWQLNQFGARFTLSVTLRRDFEPQTLKLHDAEYNVAVFRIFQEILNNIAKHSGASVVTVEARVTDCWLELQVRDNGRGIREDELHKQGSYGILGMRERISGIGGEFLIQGIPSEGTTVTVRIPVQAGLVTGSSEMMPASPDLTGTR